MITAKQSQFVTHKAQQEILTEQLRDSMLLGRVYILTHMDLTKDTIAWLRGYGYKVLVSGAATHISWADSDE